MRVEPLLPDVAGGRSARAPSSGFGALLDAAGAALGSAETAEAAFVAHRGGMQEMVVERARADIALQIAASGAQRVTQGLQTLLGMQI
jgi:hypothetical protein